MSLDLSNVQRWTAKRRSALVLRIIKGETSAKEAARKHGLAVAGSASPLGGVVSYLDLVHLEEGGIPTPLLRHPAFRWD